MCEKCGHAADVCYSRYNRNDDANATSSDNKKNNSPTALMAFPKTAKKSRETCLIGKLERRLYRLEAVPNKASFRDNNKDAARLVFLGEATNSHPQTFEDLAAKKSSNFCTKDLWHQRLGHPSSRILNQVLHSCNISVNSNEKDDFVRLVNSERCVSSKSSLLSQQETGTYTY
ncbi:unnamed protein product [Citrullus colocynthis]|uniref:GAG-pre-integrase domain-containing protein n=1 Tax=Citrullus colocynthis TaxID=252529 RepID=A0ABP0Y4J9_9ROSI